jgi:formyltetrahydrofolate deformylase
VTSTHRYILSLSCPDRIGIVAAVSTFIASHHGWITEAQNHADQTAQRFFLRHEVLADSLPFDLVEFRQRFTPVAEQFQMNWKITDSAEKKRVVILVSKLEHCLFDW